MLKWDTKDDEGFIHIFNRKLRNRSGLIERKLCTKLKSITQVKSAGVFIGKLEANIPTLFVKEYVGNLFVVECRIQCLKTKFNSHSYIRVTCDIRYERLAL